MEDKTLTFEEVWYFINILNLPGINAGTGETDKEGIELHGSLDDGSLFVRNLGHNTTGFRLVTLIEAIADWNKAVGIQKGRAQIKGQFQALMGIRS